MVLYTDDSFPGSLLVLSETGDAVKQTNVYCQTRRRGKSTNRRVPISAISALTRGTSPIWPRGTVHAV